MAMKIFLLQCSLVDMLDLALRYKSCGWRIPFQLSLDSAVMYLPFLNLSDSAANAMYLLFLNLSNSTVM